QRQLEIRVVADASALLAEATAAFPDDPSLHERRGAVAGYLRDSPLAVAEDTQAARDNPHLWCQVARHCDLGGLRTEGIQARRAELERSPGAGWLWYAHGALHLAPGYWREGEASLTRALEAGLTLPRLRAGRAHARAEQGKWQEAGDDYALA